MTSHWPYSPEQYARAVELWKELIALDRVGLYYGRHEIYLGKDRLDDDHLFTLVITDGEVTDDFDDVKVQLLSYSDYDGSDYDAANVIALKNEFDWVNTSTDGRQGEGEAWVQLGELPAGEHDTINEGLDNLESLVRTIGSLTDYALISEEVHSEYIDGLANDAWDAYLRSDLISDLEKMNPERDENGEVLELDRSMAITPEAFQDLEDELRDAYYEYEGNEWNAETATNVVNGHHEDAEYYVAFKIFGWTREDIDDAQRLRDDLENERNLQLAEWDDHYDALMDTEWEAYVKEYPLPHFGRYPRHSLGSVKHGLRSAGVKPSVESIRKEVMRQTELYVVRENESSES